jgi:hypothetical protein
LPDGKFTNPNFLLGSILEGLAAEDVGILYGHFVHIFYGYLVYVMVIGIFGRFGMFYQEKSGNPGPYF